MAPPDAPSPLPIPTSSNLHAEQMRREEGILTAWTPIRLLPDPAASFPLLLSLYCYCQLFFSPRYVPLPLDQSPPTLEVLRGKKHRQAHACARCAHWDSYYKLPWHQYILQSSQSRRKAAAAAVAKDFVKDAHARTRTRKRLLLLKGKG